jgi:hypothetical protein
VKTIKVAFIPLDNRPVSYSLPVQTASLNKNIQIFIPPKEYIGGLTHNTNTNSLLSWLDQILCGENIDIIVCCFDSVAYGGLIPSRRSYDSEKQIKSEINKFESLIKKHKKDNKIKVYAFSSIMRISNNNYNEEEKEYWNQYGEMIFKYSYLSHKISLNPDTNNQEELNTIKKLIPEDILEDYKITRQRNFNINKYYLDLAESGLIDFIVFSQDDTAEYGFNVLESKILSDFIKERKIENNTAIRTGADEIPTDLLTRAIVECRDSKISIYPIFSTESGKNVISRYEDKTIEASVEGQINLCGGKVSNNPETADMFLLVNTPIVSQNDHCMGIHTEIENIGAVNYCISIIKNSKKPVIIADVVSANGADNLLVKSILGNISDFSNIYAYAGWNTTGNTLGTAISTGIMRYLAEKTDDFIDENFKKLLLIRLADDWAYQTIARQKIRAVTSNADQELLYEELKPLIINLTKKLNIAVSEIKLSFPWNRTFEVEIEV